MEISGRYTSQTQKTMNNLNKNAIFRLLFGLSNFSLLCHKNKPLYAFRAFWDALEECLIFSITGCIVPTLAGRSDMGFFGILKQTHRNSGVNALCSRNGMFPSGRALRG
jgi:hypothetical protein